jgi:hypothetical protein
MVGARQNSDQYKHAKLEYDLSKAEREVEQARRQYGR